MKRVAWLAVLMWCAMAVGHDGVDHVWRPGVNCWTVRESCERMLDAFMFSRYVTGPGGEIRVVVIRGMGDHTVLDVPLDDMYRVGDYDRDNDNDVDLYDWYLATTTVWPKRCCECPSEGNE